MNSNTGGKWTRCATKTKYGGPNHRGPIEVRVGKGNGILLGTYENHRDAIKAHPDLVAHVNLLTAPTR